MQAERGLYEFLSLSPGKRRKPWWKAVPKRASMRFPATLIGPVSVFGHDDRDRETARRKSPGTWNVTLRFPVCNATQAYLRGKNVQRTPSLTTVTVQATAATPGSTAAPARALRQQNVRLGTLTYMHSLDN